jgi:hypothetical protein
MHPNLCASLDVELLRVFSLQVILPKVYPRLPEVFPLRLPKLVTQEEVGPSEVYCQDLLKDGIGDGGQSRKAQSTKSQPALPVIATASMLGGGGPKRFA